MGMLVADGNGFLRRAGPACPALPGGGFERRRRWLRKGTIFFVGAGLCSARAPVAGWRKGAVGGTGGVLPSVGADALGGPLKGSNH